VFEPAQMNGYVVEECLFNLLVMFDKDLKCLHQLLDLLLALLQVSVLYFVIANFYYVEFCYLNCI